MHYRGTSLIRTRILLGPYRRRMPRVIGGWARSYGRGTHLHTKTTFFFHAEGREANPLTKNGLAELLSMVENWTSLAGTYDTSPNCLFTTSKRMDCILRSYSSAKRILATCPHQILMSLQIVEQTCHDSGLAFRATLEFHFLKNKLFETSC